MLLVSQGVLFRNLSSSGAKILLTILKKKTQKNYIIKPPQDENYEAMLIKKIFSVDLVVALKEGEGLKKKRVHTQMWSWTFEDRVVFKCPNNRNT